MRIALEYAITSRFEVGGRSSLNKVVDGFLKYKALQQSTGAHAMPVSMTLFSSAAVTTLALRRWPRPHVAFAHVPTPTRRYWPQVQLQLVVATYAHAHSPQPR
ncbi:MAG: DUF5777 family beta-barrel protein [Hymenobacter sp.]